MYKPSTRVQTSLALYKDALGTLDEFVTEDQRELANNTYKALYRGLVRDNPEFTPDEINAWIMEQLKGE